MNAPKVIKKSATAPENITINSMPIVVRAVDRTSKDIGDYVDSVRSAESITSPNRTKYYDLCETVLMDGFLKGIIRKRVSAALNRDIYFKRKGERATDMDTLIRGKKFRTLKKEILMQKAYGVSGFEFIPGDKFQFKKIPRKHIKPEASIISAEQNNISGLDYTKAWNIWVIGEPYDLGYLAQCIPHALWKKGNMGDWAQYIEIFGQPMIIFYYDAHDVKTRTELESAMSSMGSGSRIQVPKQVELKMEDAKQVNGTGELQDTFRKACNEEMMVTVLGVTETTTSSQSSGYAQSKEHGKQQLEIVKDDVADLLDELNSEEFINILKSYGYNVNGGEFVCEQDRDIVQMKMMLDMDSQLSKIVPLGDDYFYDTYGRPKPKNYKELKPKQNIPETPNNPDTDPDNQPEPNKSDDRPADKLEAGWLTKLANKLSGFFAPARAN